MKLLADLPIPPLPAPIRYDERILLIGSCFTGNVGVLLEQHKFQVMHNPTGILFDPLSVGRHLRDWMSLRKYAEQDLFQHDELYHSSQHHSEFSGLQAEEVAVRINKAIAQAHDFLRTSRTLVITLGSAFFYRKISDGQRVANCHKIPQQEFSKRLCAADEIVKEFADVIAELKKFNPQLQLVFTISPVRHLRDGIVENNRSKAQLIEAVRRLCEMQDVHYFPAYELVIDVLRDYRWYDVDLAHPNYAATQYVFERFCESCIHEADRRLMDEVRQLLAARRHKAQFPGTAAHRAFLRVQHERALALQKKLPALDWSEELDYFSQAN